MRKYKSGTKITVKGTKETGIILGVDRETNSGYIEYSVRLDNPERFYTIPEKILIEIPDAKQGEPKCDSCKKQYPLYISGKTWINYEDEG